MLDDRSGAGKRLPPGPGDQKPALMMRDARMSSCFDLGLKSRGYLQPLVETAVSQRTLIAMMHSACGHMITPAVQMAVLSACPCGKEVSRPSHIGNPLPPACSPGVRSPRVMELGNWHSLRVVSSSAPTGAAHMSVPDVLIAGQGPPSCTAAGQIWAFGANTRLLRCTNIEMAEQCRLGSPWSVVASSSYCLLIRLQ